MWEAVEFPVLLILSGVVVALGVIAGVLQALIPDRPIARAGALPG